MNAFDSFTYKEIVNLLAIVVGPIAAIKVTRVIDDRRSRRDRKMHIFRTLMGTRRLKLHTEHVSALNLIEIEFYKDKSVHDKLRNYMQHLTNEKPDTSRWLEISNELFTKLVQAIGAQLGYKIDQLDIFGGGYAPRGWEMTENEQQEFRRLLIQLLEGKRSISITNMYHFGEGGTFPPPPSL